MVARRATYRTRGLRRSRRLTCKSTCFERLCSPLNLLLAPRREVFLVQDVPEESLPALEARCRQLYFNTRLGMLARPEYLSKGDGLATTYAQAERTTVDSWGLMKPLMRKVRFAFQRLSIFFAYLSADVEPRSSHATLHRSLLFYSSTTTRAIRERSTSEVRSSCHWLLSLRT